MPEMAEKIYRDLKRHFNVFFDEKGAIGRRYRRQDEAGTPFGITVDGQTPDRRHRHVPRPRQLPAVARARRRASSQALRDLLEGQADPRGRAETCDRDRATRGHDTDEALHQPGDDPEHAVRGRPAGLRAGGLDGGRALADEAGDVPRSRTRSPRPGRLLDEQGLEPGRGGVAGGAACSRGAPSARRTGTTSAAGWTSSRSWGCRS